jgi:hypothetical protein
LQLLALRHPTNRFYQSLKDGQSFKDGQSVNDGKRPRVPGPRPSWLAVYRKDDRVWRMDLDRAKFRVLEALCSGKPLASALRRSPDAGERFTQWFAEWVGEQFFQRVETS